MGLPTRIPIAAKRLWQALPLLLAFPIGYMVGLAPVWLVLIGCLSGLAAAFVLTRPEEGRATIRARYEPYNASVEPPKYERTDGFGSFDYLLGVFNEGPSIARNVVVRVMDVYEKYGDGGPARITGLYPRLCRRAETTEDNRLINQGAEALYHIGYIRDLARGYRIAGAPRNACFTLDWPTGWPPSPVASRIPHRVTLKFEITVENADPVMCELVLSAVLDEHGEHFIGEMQSQP